MIVLVILSAVLLFGFWAYCIFRYGFKDCLSRYSSTTSPVWSYVLVLSAALLMPAMLEITEGKMLQFVAFLAPVSLFVVGITPKWATDNVQYIIHNAGVIMAVIFSVAFSIIGNLVWYVLAATLVAAVCGLIDRKHWLHYAEFALYIAMFAEIFTKIC